MVPGTDDPADRPVPGASGPMGHQLGALPEQADEERGARADQQQAQVPQGGDRQEDMYVARAVQPGERQGETGPGSRHGLQPQVVRLPIALLPQRSVTVLRSGADHQLLVGGHRRGGVGHDVVRGHAKREYATLCIMLI